MLLVTRTAGLLAIAGIALFLPSWNATAPPHVRAARVSVMPEVIAALAQTGDAHVLIKLRDPSAVQGGIRDMAAARSQVAAQQAVVIDAVPTNEMQVSRRYQAIAAIAAVVTPQGLRDLAGNPAVERVEIDGVGMAAMNQSRPLIHVPEVHAAGITGDGVVVAVLDSGIDTNHADLSDDIAYERCYLTTPLACPGGAHVAEDDNGHGTNVSGIITSKGTIAPLGVAPDAQIAAYKILGSTGIGVFSDWIAALDDIVANHPEVDFVNMSLQSSTGCGAGSTLETAINTLRTQGVLTFISAGNHAVKNQLFLPGCISQAITVGAAYDANIGPVSSWKADAGHACTDSTTAADLITCWSDSSSAIDLLAPGAGITSTGFNGSTSTYYGTSQASPHAAAVAALLLDAKPGLTPDQIEFQMESTGKLLTDDLNDTNDATYRTTPRIDARVAILSDNGDSDGDGCSDSEELGADPAFGGKRNPLNPYDFFDVDGNKSIDLFEDVFGIALAFGLTPSDAGYNVSMDRSEPPPGAEVWDMGPPDGTIDVFTDIFGAASQFGHDCSALP